jgi:hypothetical protein
VCVAYQNFVEERKKDKKLVEKERKNKWKEEFNFFDFELFQCTSKKMRVGNVSGVSDTGQNSEK